MCSAVRFFTPHHPPLHPSRSPPFFTSYGPQSYRYPRALCPQPAGLFKFMTDVRCLLFSVFLSIASSDAIKPPQSNSHVKIHSPTPVHRDTWVEYLKGVIHEMEAKKSSRLGLFSKSRQAAAGSQGLTVSDLKYKLDTALSMDCGLGRLVCSSGLGTTDCDHNHVLDWALAVVDQNCIPNIQGVLSNVWQFLPPAPEPMTM